VSRLTTDYVSLVGVIHAKSLAELQLCVQEGISRIQNEMGELDMVQFTRQEYLDAFAHWELLFRATEKTLKIPLEVSDGIQTLSKSLRAIDCDCPAHWELMSWFAFDVVVKSMSMYLQYAAHAQEELLRPLEMPTLNLGGASNRQVAKA
jgi:hypothetical protein